MKPSKPVVTPLIRDLKQTYDSTCWVVLDISDEYGLNVHYFNNEKAPEDYQYADFESFVQTYVDDNFFMENKEKEMSENKIIFSGFKTSDVEDFDEDSGKSYRKTECEGQIVEIYKEFDMTKLHRVLQTMKKNLEDIKENAIDQYNEDIEYERDPYRYYGVSRGSFF